MGILCKVADNIKPSLKVIENKLIEIENQLELEIQWKKC